MGKCGVPNIAGPNPQTVGIVVGSKMFYSLIHLEREMILRYVSHGFSDGPQQTEPQLPTAITHPLTYSIDFSHFLHFLTYATWDHFPNKLHRLKFVPRYLILGEAKLRQMTGRCLSLMSIYIHFFYFVVIDFFFLFLLLPCSN